MPSLSALAAVGEFISAIAVLISLIYLALQIRQNTQTVRANTHHAGSTAWAGLTAQIASDAELSELYHQGRVSPDALSPEQTRRFELLMDSVLAQIENFFIQHRLGILPQSNQDRFAEILRAQFRSEGARRYWKRRRTLYTAPFVAYIERELQLYTEPAQPST